MLFIVLGTMFFLDIDGCLNTSLFSEYLYDFSPD